jgi:hypothetical protein
MEGYLHKKGRGLNFSFIKPWTKRFFVFDKVKNELKYFDEHKSLRGTINSAGGRAIDVKATEFPNMFEFHTSSKEVLILAADTLEEKLKWIAALNLLPQEGSTFFT